MAMAEHDPLVAQMAMVGCGPLALRRGQVAPDVLAGPDAQAVAVGAPVGVAPVALAAVVPAAVPVVADPVAARIAAKTAEMAMDVAPRHRDR